MKKDQFPVFDIGQLADINQDDLLISRFAPYLAVHKNLQQAHKHNFYHLVYFTAGGGSQTIDFQKFPVNPYQVYFMIPGQVHQWNFEGSVDGYVVNFSTTFFQSFLLKTDYIDGFPFFNGNTTEAVIDIPLSQQAAVTELFEKMLKEILEKQISASDMLRLLLLEFFILVSRLGNKITPKQASAYNSTLLRSFRLLIEKNYLTMRLPKEYAELLYITPNHLNALCNDLLGTQAGELIRGRIALEAKRLLVDQEISISEIAGRLNFADNSYFTKFFKKQTGSTPEEFRKQL